MPDLNTFTTQPPTEPGWYWAKFPDSRPFPRLITKEDGRSPDLLYGPRIPPPETLGRVAPPSASPAPSDAETLERADGGAHNAQYQARAALDAIRARARSGTK